MRIGLLSSVPVTLDSFFPNWIDYWLSLGHEVFTACGPGPDLAMVARETHTTIRHLSQRPQPSSIAVPAAIHAWQANTRLDVLIVNTATASFLARATKGPSPIIYFCHGLHWGEGQSFSRRTWENLERYALRNTSGVVTMNSVDEHWFAENFRSVAQLSLAYGVGLDPGKWPRSPSTWPQTSLRLLWVGAFTTRKNPNAFVELIRALTRSRLTVEATMLGEGPLHSRVREQAHGLPISFPGQQPPLGFLQDCHGLVLTSSWEGLPRVGLEACAVGRPVFGFNVKGVRDLPNAFVSDPQQGAPGLVNVVSDWVRDPLVDYPDPQALAYQRPAQAVLDLITGVRSHQ